MAVTYREAALRRAITYLGITEVPAGSNRGRYIDRWNLQACGTVAVFWCCSFVHGMFSDVGFSLPGGASVLNLLGEARKNGWVVKRPRRGDLACFDFSGKGVFGDHVGFVEKTLALRWSNGTFTGWIQTVEGNTSAQGDPSGSQSNGGGVFRRRRWVRGIGAEFIRVPGERPT